LKPNMKFTAKVFPLFLFLFLLVLYPDCLLGQVLVELPDVQETNLERSSSELKKSNKALGNNGVTLGGQTGLLTFPVPSVMPKGTLKASYAHSVAKQDKNYSSGSYNMEKEESFYSLRYHIRPGVEFNWSYLDYERKSFPFNQALSGDRDLHAFGMMFSGTDEEQDFCLGFNFAPMSSKDMNFFEMKYIETGRNIFFTLKDRVSQKLDGYANISYAFTKEQKIDLGGGSTIEIEKEGVLYGGIGFEYRFSDLISCIAEAKVSDYKDFQYFDDDNLSYSFNAGLKFSLESISVYVSAYNLSSEKPHVLFGTQLAF